MPARHRVVGDHAREEDMRDILPVVVHDVLDDEIQGAARGGASSNSPTASILAHSKSTCNWVLTATALNSSVHISGRSLATLT
jgi:hypothetical protein